MRVTRTTIAVLVLCFFTMQLKANEPMEASATVREGALQEALQLMMKDLKGESFIKLKLGLNLDLKLNPLPPLKAPAIVPEPNQDAPQSPVKTKLEKRKTPAPIVSPDKFRFGISDKEI